MYKGEYYICDDCWKEMHKTDHVEVPINPFGTSVKHYSLSGDGGRDRFKKIITYPDHVDVCKECYEKRKKVLQQLIKTFKI